MKIGRIEGDAYVTAGKETVIAEGVRATAPQVIGREVALTTAATTGQRAA